MKSLSAISGDNGFEKLNPLPIFLAERNGVGGSASPISKRDPRETARGAKAEGKSMTSVLGKSPSFRRLDRRSSRLGARFFGCCLRAFDKPLTVTPG